MPLKQGGSVIGGHFSPCLISYSSLSCSSHRTWQESLCGTSESVRPLVRPTSATDLHESRPEFEAVPKSDVRPKCSCSSSLVEPEHELDTFSLLGGDSSAQYDRGVLSRSATHLRVNAQSLSLITV